MKEGYNVPRGRGNNLSSYEITGEVETIIQHAVEINGLKDIKFYVCQPDTYDSRVMGAVKNKYNCFLIHPNAFDILGIIVKKKCVDLALLKDEIAPFVSGEASRVFEKTIATFQRIGIWDKIKKDISAVEFDDFKKEDAGKSYLERVMAYNTGRVPANVAPSFEARRFNAVEEGDFWAFLSCCDKNIKENNVKLDDLVLALQENKGWQRILSSGIPKSASLKNKNWEIENEKAYVERMGKNVAEHALFFEDFPDIRFSGKSAVECDYLTKEILDAVEKQGITIVTEGVYETLQKMIETKRLDYSDVGVKNKHYQKTIKFLDKIGLLNKLQEKYGAKTELKSEPPAHSPDSPGTCLLDAGPIAQEKDAVLAAYNAAKENFTNNPTDENRMQYFIASHDMVAKVYGLVKEIEKKIGTNPPKEKYDVKEKRNPLLNSLEEQLSKEKVGMVLEVLDAINEHTSEGYRLPKDIRSSMTDMTAPNFNHACKILEQEKAIDIKGNRRNKMVKINQYGISGLSSSEQK
ncbi:MAG: hypothetical protein PHC66_01720 [Candidatus Nanoarchaeia archaeon]|nr:hypothetical protein [Candidatus Nanoarchaeia archaeon]MDD5238930.1 hypothetical protein [Candidatus Nanoarchaeia archaeon]